MVALVETLFFYLAPSLVENRQGNLATALWLKRGPARGVELVVGIRVLLRSTSVDGLGVLADQPLSFTGVRTFMLPRFAGPGWPL